MPTRGTFPFAQFVHNFKLAANRSREFAEQLTLLKLPHNYLFDIGGRHVTPEDLRALGGRRDPVSSFLAVPFLRAAKLLWVDGAVPYWINIGVDSYSDEVTYFELLFCRDLVSPEKFPRIDFQEARFPFRVRGPAGPAEDEPTKPIPLQRRQ